MNFIPVLDKIIKTIIAGQVRDKVKKFTIPFGKDATQPHFFIRKQSLEPDSFYYLVLLSGYYLTNQFLKDELKVKEETNCQNFRKAKRFTKGDYCKE